MALQDGDVIEVPAAVANNARTAGAAGWLEGLPSLLAELEVAWSITIGPPYSGATEAYVAPATTVDGKQAVIKVLVPVAGNTGTNEATALQIVAGDGCPLLYRHDPARCALLMERLGRPMYELGLPLARRLELLCQAAARVWRLAPDSGLPTGAEGAGRLAEFITMTWEELGRPCSERALDAALACARRRSEAHRDERSVLVHGDVHQLNALESGDGFKLVDPAGVLAEPECDLGTLMRGDPVELLAGDPRDRAKRLAELTGCDPVAIWEWGVLQRLASGLHCTRIDEQPLGRDTLRAAEAVVGLNIG